MKKRMKSVSTAVIVSALIMGNLWGTTGDFGTAKAAEFSPVTEEQQEFWGKMEEEQKAGYNPSIIISVPDEEATVEMNHWVKILGWDGDIMEYQVIKAEFYPSIESTGYEKDDFSLSERMMAEVELSEGKTGIFIVTMEAKMLESPEFFPIEQEELQGKMNIATYLLQHGEDWENEIILMDADDDDKWERKEKEGNYFYCEAETPTTLKVGYVVEKDQLDGEMYLVLPGYLNTYVYVSLDEIEIHE